MKRGGSVIPEKLRAELAIDPEYTRCALLGHGPCGGRITWEHAIIYAGKKVQERWAIIPLCASHHNVDEYQDAKTMVKEVNVWVALNRATDEELAFYSRAAPSFTFQRDRLNAKYGVYRAPPIPARNPNVAAIVPGLVEQAAKDFYSVSPAMAAVIVTRPRIGQRLTKEEQLEREIKAYAKANGVSLEEARTIINEYCV